MAFLRSVVKNGAGNKFSVCLNGSSVQFGRASITTVKKEIKDNIAAAGQVDTRPHPKDQLDITFEDATAAFKSKTTWELIRAYLVYTICSSKYLVENNQKVRKNTIFTAKIILLKNKIVNIYLHSYLWLLIYIYSPSLLTIVVCLQFLLLSLFLFRETYNFKIIVS